MINDAKPSLYVSDGTTTVQGICKILSGHAVISVSAFLSANDYNFRKYNKTDCESYKDYTKLVNKGKHPNIENYSFVTRLFINGVQLNNGTVKKFTPDSTVKDYLTICNKNNLKVVTGLVINIPYKNNGGVRETGTYLLSSKNIPKDSLLLIKENLKKIDSKLDAQWHNYQTKGTTDVTKKITYESYFKRVEPNDKHKEAYLPVIPQEFSDSNSAAWSSVSLMGRSVDYQIYSGSSRTVSFTLQLHQELYNDSIGTKTDNIYNLVQLIESCNYPFYSEANDWAGPPQVIFKIGEQFYIKGILDGCTANWKAPFDEQGRYMCCDLNVSVKETTGPYSAEDIGKDKGAGLGGYRN